jgi:hypothetical protein
MINKLMMAIFLFIYHSSSPFISPPQTLPSPSRGVRVGCYFLFHYKKLRKKSMANELICPICEAEIPLDGDEESGDLVMCSYCKMTLKMLRTKDKWTLVDDFEE